MHTYIDYYETCPLGALAPGQVHWMCFPNVKHGPNITRLRNHRGSEPANVATFDPRQQTSDPQDKTAATEMHYLAKLKHRPVVVLTAPSPTYTSKTWREGDRVVVAPVYTLREDSGELNVEPQFAWDIRLYQCPLLFYLPNDKVGRLHESVVDVDRMRTAHVSWLQKGIVKLTDVAMGHLEQWVGQYWGLDLDPDFAASVETFRQFEGEDPRTRQSFEAGAL